MKYICISDLHLGSGDDLLASAKAWQYLEEELDWADSLILNGDVFEFMLNDFYSCIERSRGFFSFLKDKIDEIVYLPGNHDYHFVAKSADDKRFENVLDKKDKNPFAVDSAQEILEKLCPGPRIKTAYPIIELDGVVYTHGHYMAPHQKLLGWVAMDRLGWRLIGEKRREEGLSIQDYEALISPLQELMYQTSQIGAKKANAQNERLLSLAASILRAPGQVGKQSLNFVRTRARKGVGEDPIIKQAGSFFPLTRPQEAALAMEKVCQNLYIKPGPVVFGHSHAPFYDTKQGDWVFHNSGSWLYDARQRHKPFYREMVWPGVCLRIDNGKVEFKELLGTCTEQDLMNMLS